MSSLYGMITTVYRAKDIRTAEAAKVVENIQRIFLNENAKTPGRNNAKNDNTLCDFAPLR
jgi:hypothetical protein